MLMNSTNVGIVNMLIVRMPIGVNNDVSNNKYTATQISACLRLFVNFFTSCGHVLQGSKYPDTNPRVDVLPHGVF